MGSQGGYIGRIGNIIHYKMDGKLVTRSAPRKYKQTKATKAKSRGIRDGFNHRKGYQRKITVCHFLDR